MKTIIQGNTHQNALNQYNNWIQNNPNVFIMFTEGMLLDNDSFEYAIHYTLKQPNFFQRFRIFLKRL